MSTGKEEIIQEYMRIRTELGRPPGAKYFLKNSGISEHFLMKAFGAQAFNKLKERCGDPLNEFATKKSDFDVFLRTWGTLVREIESIPPISEWEHRRLQPTPSSIRRTHGLKWADVSKKFLEHCGQDPEWQDVVNLIPLPQNVIETKTTEPHSSTASLPEAETKYIPPIVQNLIELSLDGERDIEFERGVSQVFKLFGFDVEEFGQGTGRNPDTIAKEPQSQFAILIDAKASRLGYEINQEDRKFVEYIKTHKDLLIRQGCSNLYFLVVSSGFKSINNAAINKVKSETQASLSLITSLQLLRILSHKIKEPRRFDLKKIKELLVDGGEITDMNIAKKLGIKK
jgi:hypothetical protein